MLKANLTLGKQLQEIELERKDLKQSILERDKIINQRIKELESAKREKAELLEIIRQQKVQLDNWS